MFLSSLNHCAPLPSREGPRLTQEFPSISWVEGRSQDRAQHNVQLEFHPPGDELSTVHLGEERAGNMEATSMPGASWLLHGMHQALAWPRRQRQAAVLKIRSREACVYLHSMWPGIGKVPLWPSPLPRQFLLCWDHQMWAFGHENCGQPIKSWLGWPKSPFTPLPSLFSAFPRILSPPQQPPAQSLSELITL